MSLRKDNPKAIDFCEACGLIYLKKQINQKWCCRFKICREEREEAFRSSKNAYKRRRRRQYITSQSTSWTFHHEGRCIECKRHKGLNRWGMCRQCYVYINNDLNLTGDFLFE